MRETFIVKHAVGGAIYIDTAKQAVDYKLEETEGGGWLFTVETPLSGSIEELLRFRRELNVLFSASTRIGQQ